MSLPKNMEYSTPETDFAHSCANIGSGDADNADQSLSLHTKYKGKRSSKLQLSEKTVTHAAATRCLKLLSKNSRRSHQRFGRGLPKKGFIFHKLLYEKDTFNNEGGGGGKGTWGKPGSELRAADDFDDVNDDTGEIELVPNSEPEEELRNKIQPIISEYLENQNIKEVLQSLQELRLRKRLSLVPVLCIQLAFDHKPFHCELTSVLLSTLCGTLFTSEHLKQAFDRLIAELPDLILDVPDAPTILGKFIARAVADDCLPPSYVDAYKGHVDTKVVQKCLSLADQLLSVKHGLVRLDNIWGVGGGICPVKSLVRQIGLLLEEFLIADDANEAMHCLTSLEVPHFHHELVYEAIVMAIEHRHPPEEKQLCTLLHHFYTHGVLTLDQLETGIIRVTEDLSDIELDVPDAASTLKQFAILLHEAQLINNELLQQVLDCCQKQSASVGDASIAKDLGNMD